MFEMQQERMAARPSAFGDDFGQKIDLTARIREILVNYPPGSTIIKEFLQNADGAEGIRGGVRVGRRARARLRPCMHRDNASSRLRARARTPPHIRRRGREHRQILRRRALVWYGKPGA